MMSINTTYLQKKIEKHCWKWLSKRTTTSTHRSGRGSISGSLRGTGGKKVSSSTYVTMNRGTKRVKVGSAPKGRKVNRRNLRRKSGRM